MDDSVFNSSQPEMIVYKGQALSAQDQPVFYGPVLFDALVELSSRIGGADYLLGKHRLKGIAQLITTNLKLS